MSLTAITLSGSISKDAEQKITPNNNQVIGFTLMTNRYDNKSKQEKAYPVKVNLWGESFSEILPRLKQGTAVVVTGRLQLEQFNDKSGKPVRLAAIEANRVTFVDDIGTDLGVPMTTASAHLQPDSFADQEVPF